MSNPAVIGTPVENVADGLYHALETLRQTQTWLGILVLAIVAWRRFNSWAEGEEKFGQTSPPRHFTTCARYVTYAILYTLVIEVVYVVLVTMPDIIGVVADAMEIQALQAFYDNLEPGNISLWILVMLLGVVPVFPGLRGAEHQLRRRLHRSAFIPAEAEALVKQLQSRPERFQPTSGSTVAKVREELAELFPPGHDFLDPANPIEHTFFKLTYLKKRIEDWQGSRDVIRFCAACGKDYTLHEEQYENIKTDLKVYLDELAADANDAILTRLRNRIVSGMEKLEQEIYEFICCGVLATEKLHRHRMAKFGWFGLTLDYEPVMPIMLDIILKCIALVFGTTLVATTVFLLLKGDPWQQCIRTATIWSFMFLLMQGASILGAVLLDRRLSRDRRLGNVQSGGELVAGALGKAGLAFLVGYSISLVIVWLAARLLVLTGESSLAVLVRVWPWALIPAMTSGAIVYYLAPQDRIAHRWRDGAVLGGLSLFIAIIAVSLIPPSPDQNIPMSFAAYAAIACGLAGFSIGFTFPKDYQIKATQFDRRPDRRAFLRHTAALATNVVIGTDTYTCVTESISDAGVRLKLDLPHEVGTEALLSFARLGEFHGTIVRKARQLTCVKFDRDPRTPLRVSAVLG